MPSSECHAIDRLHARVKRLGDIGNIKITVRCEKRLRDQLKSIDFTIKSTQGNEKLVKVMKGLSLHSTKAWFNPEHPGEELEEIEVTRIINWREVTYGVENLAVIAEAKMVTTVPQDKLTTMRHKTITVKIREVTRQYESLTEDEGQNAVNTARNDKIKNLFPTLYCVGSIDCSPYSSWEFIGMELLEPLNPPGIQHTTREDLQNAMKILVKLHGEGYVHGDSHLSNFMRVPANSTHPELEEGRVIMIDQDSIRRLPDDPSLENVAKYRIADDFNLLLLWWNRFVPFYLQFKQDALSEKFRQIYYYAPKLYPFMTPTVCGYTKDYSDSEVAKILEMARFARYNELLSTKTLEDIYNFYHFIFFHKDGFQRVQNKLTLINELVSNYKFKGSLR
jgi:hypothetical protein